MIRTYYAWDKRAVARRPWITTSRLIGVRESWFTTDEWARLVTVAQRVDRNVEAHMAKTKKRKPKY